MPNILNRRYAFTLLFLTITLISFSQSPKRICVLGSSSAFGYFGNPPQHPKDSAWVYRVKNHYKNLGVIDTLFNLAISGTDPYSAMPTSYVPPPGRALPDPLHNITRAVNLIPKPDVIIVNFPTNHYDYFTLSEVIMTLQTIKDSANAKGILCYITTTQPRDGFSPTERQKLKDLKLIIESVFGLWSIDFWTELVVDSNLKIKPDYAFGDLVHVNPPGHRELYQKVIEKNIFFSLVSADFGKINAIRQGSNVLVSWQIMQENNNKEFIIERSHNGIDFIQTGIINSAGNNGQPNSYSFIDPSPGSGKLYYRIVATGYTGAKQFSSIVVVKEGSGKPEGFIYPTFTTDKLSLVLGSDKNEDVRIKITDLQGKTMILTKAFINSHSVYNIPVSSLPSGSYVFTTEFDGAKQSHRFVKL